MINKKNNEHFVFKDTKYAKGCLVIFYSQWSRHYLKYKYFKLVTFYSVEAICIRNVPTLISTDTSSNCLKSICSIIRESLILLILGIGKILCGWMY